MSLEKKNRNSVIVTLVNGGMTSRAIAKIWGLKHPTIVAVNKRLNSKDKRHCILCGTNENLINNDICTICSVCEKNIKNV